MGNIASSGYWNTTVQQLHPPWLLIQRNILCPYPGTGAGLLKWLHFDNHKMFRDIVVPIRWRHTRNLYLREGPGTGYFPQFHARSILLNTPQTPTDSVSFQTPSYSDSKNANDKNLGSIRCSPSSSSVLVFQLCQIWKHQVMSQCLLFSMCTEDPRLTIFNLKPAKSKG